jgi:hypothetical protein
MAIFYKIRGALSCYKKSPHTKTERARRRRRRYPVGGAGWVLAGSGRNDLGRLGLLVVKSPRRIALAITSDKSCS